MRKFVDDSETPSRKRLKKPNGAAKSRRRQIESSGEDSDGEDLFPDNENGIEDRSEDDEQPTASDNEFVAPDDQVDDAHSRGGRASTDRSQARLDQQRLDDEEDEELARQIAEAKRAKMRKELAVLKAEMAAAAPPRSRPPPQEYIAVPGEDLDEQALRAVPNPIRSSVKRAASYQEAPHSPVAAQDENSLEGNPLTIGKRASFARVPLAPRAAAPQHRDDPPPPRAAVPAPSTQSKARLFPAFDPAKTFQVKSKPYAKGEVFDGWRVVDPHSAPLQLDSKTPGVIKHNLCTFGDLSTCENDASGELAMFLLCSNRDIVPVMVDRLIAEDMAARKKAQDPNAWKDIVDKAIKHNNKQMKGVEVVRLCLPPSIYEEELQRTSKLTEANKARAIKTKLNKVDKRDDFKFFREGLVLSALRAAFIARATGDPDQFGGVEHYRQLEVHFASIQQDKGAELLTDHLLNDTEAIPDIKMKDVFGNLIDLMPFLDDACRLYLAERMKAPTTAAKRSKKGTGKKKKKPQRPHFRGDEDDDGEETAEDDEDEEEEL